MNRTARKKKGKAKHKPSSVLLGLFFNQSNFVFDLYPQGQNTTTMILFLANQSNGLCIGNSNVYKNAWILWHGKCGNRKGHRFFSVTKFSKRTSAPSSTNLGGYNISIQSVSSVQRSISPTVAGWVVRNGAEPEVSLSRCWGEHRMGLTCTEWLGHAQHVITPPHVHTPVTC